MLFSVLLHLVVVSFLSHSDVIAILTLMIRRDRAQHVIHATLWLV